MKRFAVGDKFRVADLFGGNGYRHEVTKIWTEKGLDGTDIKYMETRETWTNEDTWETEEATETYMIFEDQSEEAEAIKVWEWNGEAEYEWAKNEEEEKEMANAQVNIIEIEVEGIRYTQTRPGYYYKKTEDGQKRISKAEWEQAFDAYTAQVNEADEEWDIENEVEARKEAEDKKDRETEQNFNSKKETKKAAKPRRPKDVAFEMDTIEGHITLTAKQVDFIKHLPDTCFWENGLDSAPWCDILADEIGGQFAGKPMTVGAMISTLREKKLVSVGRDLDRKGKPKFMTLTAVGRAIAEKLGLH